MGKRLFKKDDDDDEGSSGGIISALKSFDRDGDGKITENGIWNNIISTFFK